MSHAMELAVELFEFLCQCRVIIKEINPRTGQYSEIYRISLEFSDAIRQQPDAETSTTGTRRSEQYGGNGHLAKQT